MDVLVAIRSARTLRLAAFAVLCAALAPAIARAQTTEPHARAWNEIEALAAELDATPEAGQTPQFAQAAAARDALAKRCRSFLTNYPGAPERLQAVRYELEALFERDCLTGGDLGELCARADHFYESSFPADTRAEAAYWRILCQRRGRIEAQPSALASVTRVDPELSAAAEAYLQEFPRGGRAVFMLETLFTAAEQAGDRETMRDVLNRLQGWRDGDVAPDIALSASLAGRLARAEAIGQKVAAPPGAGAAWSTPCLVVVRMAEAPGGSWLCEELEGWRGTHPEVGLLRATVPAAGGGTAAPSTASRATASGPGAPSDGPGALGWKELAPEASRALAERWQVTDFPMVFVIDRDGVLRAAAGPADWLSAAERLKN